MLSIFSGNKSGIRDIRGFKSGKRLKNNDGAGNVAQTAALKAARVNLIRIMWREESKNAKNYF